MAPSSSIQLCPNSVNKMVLYMKQLSLTSQSKMELQNVLLPLSQMVIYLVCDELKYGFKSAYEQS